MKIRTFLMGMMLLTGLASFAQSKVPATIKLKDGKTIDVYHFGRLVCESNRYAATFTILRGKYFGSHTEINEYNDVSQLILTGFTEAPAVAAGNQKGKITVIKKDGVKVELEEAELVMSCFGPGEKHNQIRIQIMNPLTKEPVDLSVEVRNIESISFK